jgi:hypothetical protein
VLINDDTAFVELIRDLLEMTPSQGNGAINQVHATMSRRQRYAGGVAAKHRTRKIARVRYRCR